MSAPTPNKLGVSYYKLIINYLFKYRQLQVQSLKHVILIKLLNYIVH